MLRALLGEVMQVGTQLLAGHLRQTKRCQELGKVAQVTFISLERMACKPLLRDQKIPKEIAVRDVHRVGRGGIGTCLSGRQLFGDPVSY